MEEVPRSNLSKGDKEREKSVSLPFGTAAILVRARHAIAVCSRGILFSGYASKNARNSRGNPTPPPR